MMKTPIKYSFVVPVYNRENEILKAINSILQQKNKNFEIIIVDDGSEDNTKLAIDKINDKLCQIKYFKSNHKGQTNARRLGIRESAGDYICFVDSDDWISAEYLTKIDDALNKYNRPDILFFNGIIVSDNSQDILPYSKTRREGLYNRKKIVNELHKCLIYQNKKDYPLRWHTWGAVFDRKLINAFWCDDDNIINGEDGVTIAECVYNADAIAFINEELYYYNDTLTDSISRQIGRWNYVNYYWYLYKKFNSKDNEIIKQLFDHYLWSLNTGYFRQQILDKRKISEISKDFYDVKHHFYEFFKNVKINRNTPIKYKFLFYCIERKILACYLLIYCFYLKIKKN